MSSIQDSPRLLLISRSSQAVQKLFPQVLGEALIDQYLLWRETREESVEKKLSAVGLVSERTGMVEVYEEVASLLPAETGAGLFRSAEATLSPALQLLQDAWQRSNADLPWSVIAHNLVLAYILGFGAGKIILDLSREEVVPLIVARPSEMGAIWPTYIAVNKHLGMTDLWGKLYPHSEQIARLLRHPHNLATLASCGSEREMIIYGDIPLRLLGALGGYSRVSPGPWQPPLFYLSWPVITPRHMTAVRSELLQVLRIVRSLLVEGQRLVSFSSFDKGEVALLKLWLDFVGAAGRSMIQDGLLPPAVKPRLDEFFDAGPELDIQSAALRGLGG